MKRHRLFPNAKGKKQVTLFKRESSYYARYSVQNITVSNGNRYITESLKTLDYALATERAWERLAAIRVAEKSGVAVRSETVSSVIAEFLTAYQDALELGMSNFTPSMLRGYKKTIGRYWAEYLQDVPLSDVSHQHLAEYEKWRIKYWQRWSDAQRLKTRRLGHRSDDVIKLPSNAKLRPSHRTLVWEINAFKQFLRWAQQRGKYRGDAQRFVIKKATDKRRSGFTSAEYTRITSTMRRKDWVLVGKHKNDARLSRYRTMLRAYVLFMANTGLRPGEARSLCWRDITYATNKSGDTICHVQVAQSHSKVKKRRVAIGMAKAAEVIQQLRSIRESQSDFSEKEDFIWCDESGRLIRDFREGFNSLLKMSKAEFDTDNVKHTIYSLRHFYITERLKDGVPIYEIANNCGTSVAMIEKYYSDARSTDFQDRLTRSRFSDRLSPET